MEIPENWPPTLEKACQDLFLYAVRLRTGETWLFEKALPINPEWVELRIRLDHWAHKNDLNGMTFPRGVEVRVSDIVWIADAPFGS